MSTKKSDFSRILLGLFSFAALSTAIYMVFIYVPEEKTMGIIQKIFYFHLPLAWISFLSFLTVFINSIIFLIKKSIKYDILASSAAEIGTLFSTMVLITGSIWAKRIWNTWWLWEPRLTTMLVLWFIYLGYLMIRRVIENAEKKAQISAVIGIAGFFNVPIVFMSIMWWRTMHPVIIKSPRMGLAPSMLQTLMVSLGGFTLLYLYFIILRYRIGIAEHRIDEMEKTLNE